MTFFYDLNKRLAAVNDKPETTQLNERDMGKHNNATTGFKALAKKAGGGEKGERIAGAQFQKMKKAGQLEGAYQAGPDKSQIPAVNRPGNRVTLQDLEKERTQSPTSPEGLKRAQQRLGQQHPIGEKMNPAKQKSFAALAPPKDKITFADKIAGAKKEVDEMLGDVAAEAMKNAMGGKKQVVASEDDDKNPFTNFKKPRKDTPRVGDVEHGHKHDITHTATGRKVIRRADDQGISVGSETDDEGNAQEKRGRGRPKGAAKGTERVTAKATKHKGEREKKGSAGSVSDSGKALQGFMIGNKPKTEPGKVSVRNKMKEGDADPTDNDSGDLKAAMALLKKAGYKVSKSEEKESTADRDDHAEQAGKKFTKDVEAVEKKPKKKEKTEEAGGTGTPTASSGFGYGKGIYDSLNRDVENAINESMQQLSESMSINMSDSSEGGKSLTITATDEDALKLATLLKSAGLGSGDTGGHEEHGHESETCETCGSTDCGCGDVHAELEEVSQNHPDYPTDTETSHDAMQYSGGLNRNKSSGMATIPVTDVSLDGEDMFSKQMHEEDSLARMMEMAGIKEAKKVEEDDVEEGNKFTGNLAKARADGKKEADLDGDGDMEKVDESILAATRKLWKKYQE
jgi:hypothetical protein